MDQRVQVGGLAVAASLHRFIVEEALPGTGVDPETFWQGADALVHDLAPRNRELLARREELQSRLDDWHREHPGVPDADGYEAFLRELGYLLDEPEDVTVTTADVDDEVARIAGPQLVVPLLNARFAANAVNARWGSLYDALYGTDVVPREGDLAPGDGYNKVRGDEVIARGRAFLDEHFPLAGGSHADATAYAVDGDGLAVTVKDDVVRLADPAQLVGHRGRGQGARGGRAGAPRAARGDPGRPRRRDRVDRRGRGEGPAAGVGGVHDHGPRGLRGRGRRGRQGRRLPQLAAAHGGHARPGGHEERQDVHPTDEPRPDLHLALG